jgi:hypothetical protein
MLLGALTFICTTSTLTAHPIDIYWRSIIENRSENALAAETVIFERNLAESGVQIDRSRWVYGWNGQ